MPPLPHVLPSPPAAPAAPVLPPPPAPRAVAWAEARMLAHGAARRPLRSVPVPLREAAGSTLADDLRTPLPVPAFDTAAMDGFAVSGRGPWTIRGVARAGAAWPGELGAGDAVEISTGAPVPCGADAVLPKELAGRDGDGRVRGPVQEAGRHIRRTGEDAAAGACLAPAGTRVGPALIGIAAGCGHDTLSVRPRARVALLVSGDELDLTGVPGPGRVRDALGPLLPALVAELGGETVATRHVPDRPEGGLASAVHARRDAEVVVVTGSTSVGDTDQLRRLLADAGARMVVDTVACRPGHPMLLAELPTGRLVVGLPGNPYAALVAARTLLGPLIAGLAGRPAAPLPCLPVRGGARTAPGSTRLVPVAWEGGEARIVAGHGAAFLQGAAVADALAALPPGWRDGDPAPLLPQHG
ncbi:MULTISPECIES: molybdopterin molybdotransferase MoeA [unclassified Streptomyces]|uniref:molybdopterin molybdotransferase MoeA n=1 Tax=unclassified Streptomyces TaxID=2593676 RepID=UPI002E2F8FB3|nr:molybdopterin molybdotransferase MoeA [Streptomyces sp. NBC_01268]